MLAQLEIGLTEFHEVANIFPLMQGDEYKQLVEDIKLHGLREPIWLHDNKIIDGRNRYKACLDAGVTPEFVEWDKQGSLVAFVVSLNLHRRHLDESQRALVGAKIKPLFEEEAKKRQLVLAGSRPNSQIDLSANLRQGEKAKSSEQAAQAVNVSPRSVENASKVLREGTPELVQAVEQGQVAVSTAALIAEAPAHEQKEIVAKGEKEILKAAKEIRAQKEEIRREERINKIADISKNNLPLENGIGLFPVIYCDPAWQYSAHSDPADDIENHYPTMPLSEIMALPLQDIATPDAILFLWATSPLLEDALKVISAWGFTYKTSAVWDKEIMGMGYYFRIQHELLLVATKGQMPSPSPGARVSSVIREKKTEHSKKPNRVYEIIEAMYPGLPKLEMFARASREGWRSWGNQSENNDRRNRLSAAI